MTDPVAEAIAKAASQPRRYAGQINLGTGRSAVVNVPADLTPAELIVLIGSLATRLPVELSRASVPPRIVVPT